MKPVLNSLIVAGGVSALSLMAGAAAAQSLPDVSDLVEVPEITEIDLTDNVVPDITVDPIGEGTGDGTGLDGPIADLPITDMPTIDVPEVDLTDVSGFTGMRDLFESALANQDFDGDGVIGDVTDLAGLKALIKDQAKSGTLRDSGTFDVVRDAFIEMRSNDDFAALRPNLGAGFINRVSHGNRGHGFSFDATRLTALQDMLANGALPGTDLTGELPTDLTGLSGGGLQTLIGGLLQGGGLGNTGGGAGGFDLTTLGGFGGFGGADAAGSIDPSSLLSGLRAGGAGGVDLSAILSGFRGRAR